MPFSKEEIEFLEHASDLLAARMKNKKKRYIHSTLVAKTAYQLAQTYEVDVFDATVAGLLHDWDKVLDNEETLLRATNYGIKLSDTPIDCLPFFHGPLAACELPHIFSGISDEVLHAIAVHTIACEDMSPLDMVIFIADAIEPNRNGEVIENLRTMVGKVSLEELFFQTFTAGLIFVLQSGRHFYGGASSIYNHFAARRI